METFSFIQQNISAKPMHLHLLSGMRLSGICIHSTQLLRVKQAISPLMKIHQRAYFRFAQQGNEPK
jgi:hypothetical protein